MANYVVMIQYNLHIYSINQHTFIKKTLVQINNINKFLQLFKIKADLLIWHCRISSVEAAILDPLLLIWHCRISSGEAAILDPLLLLDHQTQIPDIYIDIQASNTAQST